MRIGSHVSAAGGLANAVANARKLGCETFQVLVSNPRRRQCVRMTRLGC